MPKQAVMSSSQRWRAAGRNSAQQGGLEGLIYQNETNIKYGKEGGEL